MTAEVENRRHDLHGLRRGPGQGKGLKAKGLKAKGLKAKGLKVKGLKAKGFEGKGVEGKGADVPTLGHCAVSERVAYSLAPPHVCCAKTTAGALPVDAAV